MIEMDNVVRTYLKNGSAIEVLRGVSLRIAKGEFVAIMGTSGTGKSTLMNILGGLDKPTSGAYRLDGRDMTRASEDELAGIRNRTIGFVFQQFFLLDRADALKNVRLPLLYAEAAGDDVGKAERALSAVHLGHHKHHRPAELSGGQQQRVAIARALVTDPPLILADEPTGNLDGRSALEILAIFQRLHREGRTLVMVTHDEGIAAHAERLIVLKDGVVARDEPVAERRNAESLLGTAQVA